MFGIFGISIHGSECGFLGCFGDLKVGNPFRYPLVKVYLTWHKDPPFLCIGIYINYFDWAMFQSQTVFLWGEGEFPEMRQ